MKRKVWLQLCKTSKVMLEGFILFIQQRMMEAVKEGLIERDGI